MAQNYGVCQFHGKKSKNNDVAFLTNDERVLMFRSSLIDGQILGESSALVREKKVVASSFMEKVDQNPTDFRDLSSS